MAAQRQPDRRPGNALLWDPNLQIPRQPDGVAYIVFDARFARKFSQWPYFISTAPGVAFAYFDDYRRARPDLFHQGSTLAALAAEVGFAPDALAASVASSNAARPEEMAARPRGRSMRSVR